MTANRAPLPPGSLGIPFIGERPQFFDNDYLAQQYRTHGPVFKTRVLGRNIAVFLGAEGNRFVLASGMKYLSARDGWPPTFRALLGDSLFTQDGDIHRKMRRLIMPALHQEALPRYLDTMVDVSERYTEQWAQKDEIVCIDAFKQFTFEVASILLTGSEPGDDIAYLSGHFHTLTKGFVAVPVNWRRTAFGRAMRARRVLLDFIDEGIENRRRNPTDDVLSLLVGTIDEDGIPLSNSDVQAQTLLMLFAGHETSASLLTSMLLALHRNPEIKEKARAEQLALVDQPLTMGLVRDHMPYLDQILKETERLYPPVPAGFRRVIAPFEFNGYHVPKGWTAMYLINAAHRDPSVYRDPDRFDPDRFSPSRDEGRKPFTLVGFGGGARFCVGFAFAQLELKVMAARLLRHYDWEVPADQDISTRYRPTLAPRSGLRVRMQHR
jgi:retinoid hydroxylase